MPRLPQTARSRSQFWIALCAGYLAHCAALAQTANDTTPQTPRPQLRLERQLDEHPAAVRTAAATFARAYNIEGTIDERLILRGDAEIRRAGTVVRGDIITYTQATDIVNVEGHARVFRDGASFSGPRLDLSMHRLARCLTPVSPTRRVEVAAMPR